MGAQAVGIGRPYLWGLGAFGHPSRSRARARLLRMRSRTLMVRSAATPRVSSHEATGYAV